MYITLNKILMRIEQLCQQKHITKYKLAKNMNIPQTTISNSFSNDTMPTIGTLEKICEGLGITMAQFFSEEEAFFNLTNEQQELLKLWNKVPVEKHDKAMAYLEGLSEK